jgi:hypothetical protein
MRSKGNPAKCKRRRACVRRFIVAMLVEKGAHTHLRFSSEWLRGPNNSGSAHTVSSNCVTIAGRTFNKICQDFSNPYCPSHGPVDCFELRFAAAFTGIRFSGVAMVRKDGFTADLCRTRLVSVLDGEQVLGLGHQRTDVHIRAFSDSTRKVLAMHSTAGCF